jgi:hypothetical protein
LVVAVFFLVAKQQTTHWKDTISLWSKKPRTSNLNLFQRYAGTIVL